MTEAYPLRWPDGWPRTKARRGDHPFSVSPGSALQSVYDGLQKLGARSAVVSSNCKVSSAGRPYAEDLQTRLLDPGVAVYFQLKARPFVMAQDAFSYPWENMRSLALAIEALRSLERHGGGHMMQRSFDGFAALPPPGGAPAFEKEPWRVVLGMGWIPPGGNPGALAAAESVYRMRAKKEHKAGADHERMARLNLAIADAREELK